MLLSDSSLPFKGFAAAMIAMSFLYLQGGRLIDVLTAILAGSLGYLVTEILDRKLHAQFIPEFIGSLVIGIIAVIGHTLIPTGDLATIIIAAVMPIVPGINNKRNTRFIWWTHVDVHNEIIRSIGYCVWHRCWRW